jgi:hypothetical protein
MRCGTVGRVLDEQLLQMPRWRQQQQQQQQRQQQQQQQKCTDEAYPVGISASTTFPTQRHGDSSNSRQVWFLKGSNSEVACFTGTPWAVRCQLYAASLTLLRFCTQDCPYDPFFAFVLWKEVSVAVRSLYGWLRHVCALSIGVIVVVGRTHRPADYVTFTSTDDKKDDDDVERRKKAQREQSLAVVLQTNWPAWTWSLMQRTTAAWAAELDLRSQSERFGFDARMCK